MEPVLCVRDITAVFGRPGQAERRAVDNVSFDLFPGDCLGIIGERQRKDDACKCDHASCGAFGGLHFS